MPNTTFELKLKIIPQASKNEIVGFFNGAIKIKIKAPPTDGKANKELIKFLKKMLRPHIQSIEIKKGPTSSQKTLLITGDQIKIMKCFEQ